MPSLQESVTPDAEYVNTDVISEIISNYLEHCWKYHFFPDITRDVPEMIGKFSENRSHLSRSLPFEGSGVTAGFFPGDGDHDQPRRNLSLKRIVTLKHL